MSGPEAANFNVGLRTIADSMEQYRGVAEKAAPLLPRADPDLQQHWIEMQHRLREALPQLRRALRAAERAEKVLSKALRKPRRRLLP